VHGSGRDDGGGQRNKEESVAQALVGGRLKKKGRIIVFVDGIEEPYPGA
jgi:hypothetical protein